ncbi:outer membrane protein, TIGR04327 family [Leptospira yanagawae serovar Saopaulo str. Sao Paulo = ATCC 700523]|uniref:Outer membrane protein, TIGR04327 family n=1 Tax=Leptospira yanagawae serovar Saopaulo str. Sao Paulo = ATCC 700523 TaxID=1249483 RepID=A0A5E8HFR8_9LEPT|nr:outer membrane protein, TIGR04327 family [Leptospira yanagawae]EOQ90104.1 outer membrane protein, TIGR04327 family [Leptospira yanagawae serovar Saopaulo str. Sao Paulo = ATCC 700523]
MNLKTLLLIFFLSTNILFAQDAVEERKTNPKTYEYGLKGQNFTYVPFETNSIIAYNKSDLRNNKDLVYLPFFKYRNMEKKFGFDFDMVNIKLADPYQKTFYLGSNGLFPSAIPYGNFQRQEYRFNFFYMPLENQIFYFGLGLLKIDRMYEVENYEFTDSIRYDKINSYGISIPLRSNIQIWEGLELNLGLDPYITYGNRDYVNQWTGNRYSADGRYGPYFSLSKTNPNNITEILGFQAEISLSYKIYDQTRLYFGFMRNQSKIRSINFDQTNYTYYGADNQLYVTSRSPFESAIDTHSSYYLGISNTH